MISQFIGKNKVMFLLDSIACFIVRVSVNHFRYISLTVMAVIYLRKSASLFVFDKCLPFPENKGQLIEVDCCFKDIFVFVFQC